MSIVERAIEKAGAIARAQADASNQGRARRLPSPSAQTAGRLETSGKTVDLALGRLRELGLIPPEDMRHVMSEELRVIKRPLLLNAEDPDGAVPNGNILVIASALPGAGKTFLSLNLALSMASEMDWSVLLVDGDVSRPNLSRLLGLEEAPGLVTLLEQESGDFGAYVYKTSQPRLHFLPAGASRPHAKELLSSQRMRSLVATLKEGQERRIVLFDSPPLLLTSEARVLASYAGQIVVVVESGITPRRSLLEAIEMLDPTKAINLVLNKSRQLLGIDGYYYNAYEPYGRDPKG